ncbi:MAG TPA: PIG-L family deacetylase, partial [Abditibacteriaceae bacterium]
VPFHCSYSLQVNSLRKLLPLITVLLLLLSNSIHAAPEPLSGVAIQQELRRFREMGSVLYVAAHPDDENTQLITYLARGRGYRTAYLSLTRGDGGQNVIGAEFGAQLGMIRTQELLAARRLDGAKQFFTRALDFGFSKDYQETLNIWDHQQVLADVVRVIRIFRPDVVITRFSPQPGGTHGHHTASAVLALEAFKLAGDAKAFPEQLGELKPWQPKRILMNGRGSGTLQMDISGTDPVLGQPFSKIAERSRAMHISQGFADYRAGEARAETFQLLGGEPATKDILEGVDTTWNRVNGGAEVARLADEVLTAFNSDKPADSVPALLQLRTRLNALPDDSIVNEKRRDLDRIIQHCVGLTVETVVPQAEVVPGESLKLRHSALVRSVVPVRWLSVKYPANNGAQITNATTLQRDQTAIRETVPVLAPEIPLSQPYWLREEGTAGMARVADPKLIGQPENAPAFAVQYTFEIGGQQITIDDEPVQVITNAAKGETPRRLEVVAPVSLHLLSDVRLFAPGAMRPVFVEVIASRANIAGSLMLNAPVGWRVEPATQPFRITAAGEQARLSFNVTAPNQATSANITARATVNGKQFDTQRVEINYPHIPPLLVQSPARLKAVVLDLAIRGREVGYLPGAGDSVAQALEEMGYKVTQLTGADLTQERLKRFDAVVIGVRAFNVRTDLPDLAGLFAYVENGGNVIAQYNRPNDLKTKKIAPFDLALSGQRVTNENAPVTFLAPEHPALNTPNKITQADFEGWVQERGIYFPNQWDARFTPLLAIGDPGEEALKGALLVAPHGRGNFVYTGLVFFRQLPAGVPGAYRLLANLVSLGK